MSSTACVQLLGLLLDITGAMLFAWGELHSLAANLAQTEYTPPRKPWYRTGPLWLAKRLGSHNALARESFIVEELPLKFWGLVFIIAGFLLQAVAVLGEL